MNLGFDNIKTIDKWSLVPSIAIIVALFSMSYIFDDVKVSLFLSFFILIGVITVFIIIKYPFGGVILIILSGYLNNLIIGIPLVNSGARLIGGIVAIGWFFNYFINRKTLLFKLMDINKFFLLFILSMSMSSVLASDPLVSFIITLKISLYIAIILFIQDLVTDKKKLNYLIIAIALCAGIASIIGFYQYFLLSSGQDAMAKAIYSQEGEIKRLGGIGGGANSYAATLMAGIPILTFISFNHKNNVMKMIFFIMLISSIVQLGLTISRTHILGCLVFAVIFVLLNIKYKNFTKSQLSILLVFIIILFIILSSFLIDHMSQRSFELDDTSTNVRQMIFLKSIHALEKNPFFGIGFNNLQITQYSRDISGIGSFTDWRDGHDFVSIVVVSVGSVGLITLILIFFKTFRYLNTAIKLFARQKNKYLLSLLITIKSAIICHILMSPGNAVIFNRTIWIYIALVIVVYRWITLDKVALNEKHVNHGIPSSQL